MMLTMKVWIVLLHLTLVSGHNHCPRGCTCDPVSRYVNCDGKRREQLRRVPGDIPTYAVSLSIKNNNISSLRKGSFQGLNELRFLYLENNLIHFIEDGAFSGLENLKRLNLSHNKLHFLTNKFANVFLGLDNLQELYLSYDSLVMIPDMALRPLARLVKLTMEGNAIQDATMGKGFRTLRNLKILSISGNSLGNLTNDNFGNIKQSKLERLYILNCNITHIQGETFKGMVHLKTLSLTGNELVMAEEDKNAMLKPLCDAKVEYLNLGKINLESIPETISCFQNLKFLNVSGNNIQILEDNVFDFSHQLDGLEIGYNKQLSSVQDMAFKGLNKLDLLVMQHCALTRFPIFADRQGNSFVPNISSIDLSHNRISFTTIKGSRSPMVGLEQAKQIWLKFNDIQLLSVDLLAPLHNVERLGLGENPITDVEPKTFTQLRALERLELDHARATLRKDCSYFNGLSRLKYLRLMRTNLYNFNSFHQTKVFNPGCLFKGLFNLHILDIASTDLHYLPSTFFNDLKNLKELFLSNNHLEVWDENIFQHTKMLQFLDISSNAIRTINESSLKQILPTLKRFNACVNPYRCDCRLAWYADWVRRMHAAKNFTLTINGSHKYDCENIKGESVLDYNPSFYECHRVIILTLSGTAGLLLLTAVVGGLLYHYRWYIRYWMFLLRSRRIKYEEEQDPLLYTYDCFATYSSEDSPWVIRTLLPKLEQQFGFRVCIHERDFELGKDISQNIAESIECSRKVLVVLTRRFLESGWCQFEVNLAHANTLHNFHKAQQSLIILMMEDVPLDGMTPILRYLIRKKTYIEWVEDEPGQTLFWNRLKEAIGRHGRPAYLGVD